MPFFKKDNEQLLSGNWVAGPYDSFLLTEETKDQHTYPVDGWYWFADLNAALAGLPRNVTSVTMRQARKALLQFGLLDAVNTMVAGADEATKIEWEYSNEVERNNQFVVTLSAALGLSNEQLDELFSVAATL